VKQVSSSLKAYIEANNGSIDELMKIINDAKLSKSKKKCCHSLNVTQNEMAAALIGAAARKE
jgi:hypothetical protein